MAKRCLLKRDDVGTMSGRCTSIHEFPFSMAVSQDSLIQMANHHPFQKYTTCPSSLRKLLSTQPSKISYFDPLILIFFIPLYTASRPCSSTSSNRLSSIDPV